MSDLGNKEVLAQNLKYYMNLNHVDRNQVCTDLGFKYTTLTDWINSKTYPRIDKIEMMANYFGIQKSDLIERKENRKMDFSELDNAIIAKAKELTDEDKMTILRVIESINKDIDRKK